jgi:excisionase family DNA binding protein
MNYTQETINELDELIVQEELQDEIRRLEKSWMDIKKVARYTSLSISTINRAVASGRLKTSKVTGKLLFKKEWVDGWLNG